MLENIRLSFQGIWSHKMRSFLTMLGIIIGIAAIIAIVSTIKGTNDQIQKNLIGSGDNTVSVELYNGDYTYETEYEGMPNGVPLIDEDVLEEVRGQEHVTGAATYVTRDASDMIYYKSTSLSGGKLYGVSSDYFATCNYVVRSGRAIDGRDEEKLRRVAVVDEDCAETLFQGEDPVGKTIEIKKAPYTVIGVIAKAESFEPVITSMEDYYTYEQSSSGKVYISYVTWPAVCAYDEPQNLVVGVDSTDHMTAVGKKCAELLNAYVTSDTITYKAVDLLEQAKEIQQLSQSTNTMLIWIAGISLLVGGIGVMNIMLVSVTERTQEIGLKKAIGARKSRILGQFLTEAAVLTSMGGLMGVLVGIVLAKVVSFFSGTPASISIPAAVGAVAFSMAIGIIFGLLPSCKAANLNPIEALRRE